jgi:hypothetical protein
MGQPSARWMQWVRRFLRNDPLLVRPAIDARTVGAAGESYAHVTNPADCLLPSLAYSPFAEAQSPALKPLKLTRGRLLRLPDRAISILASHEKPILPVHVGVDLYLDR